MSTIQSTSTQMLQHVEKARTEESGAGDAPGRMTRAEAQQRVELMMRGGSSPQALRDAVGELQSNGSISRQEAASLRGALDRISGRASPDSVRRLQEGLGGFLDRDGRWGANTRASVQRFVNDWNRHCAPQDRLASPPRGTPSAAYVDQLLDCLGRGEARQGAVGAPHDQPITRPSREALENFQVLLRAAGDPRGDLDLEQLEQRLMEQGGRGAGTVVRGHATSQMNRERSSLQFRAQQRAYRVLEQMRRHEDPQRGELLPQFRNHPYARWAQNAFGGGNGSSGNVMHQFGPAELRMLERAERDVGIR